VSTPDDCLLGDLLAKPPAAAQGLWILQMLSITQGEPSHVWWKNISLRDNGPHEFSQNVFSEEKSHM